MNAAEKFLGLKHSPKENEPVKRKEIKLIQDTGSNSSGSDFAALLGLDQVEHLKSDAEIFSLLL